MEQLKWPEIKIVKITRKKDFDIIIKNESYNKVAVADDSTYGIGTAECYYF